jgi:hypothetical protein
MNLILRWIIAAILGPYLVFLPLIANDPHPACSYWVAPAPTGSDSNPGSYARPWATLAHAAKTVPDNFCTVWFLPGKYPGENRLSRRFATPTTFKSVQPYRAELHAYGAPVIISGGVNITIEGFDIHQTGPGAVGMVVAVDHSDKGWAEFITLRNILIHDSYDNDLLKIYSGVRYAVIQNNIFYNQGPPEEQMDVNSVTDVVIEDNIFFNSYQSSGRTNTNQSKQYIVIKDSDGTEDGLLGSQNITVRRNVFLNWQGQSDETIIQVGLDGKPYFEAIGVRVENNLIIGNSPIQVGRSFGVRGAKDVKFINNTVVGDLPSEAYAAWVDKTGLNPNNQNITFRNNIWSDSTGTMGAGVNDLDNDFADGDPLSVSLLVLDNNLYWNGSRPIPPGDLLSPLLDDHHLVIGAPLLNESYQGLVLPVWNGTSFASGSLSIREEFLRLVRLYGTFPGTSPAIDKADPAFAPGEDIFGRQRDAKPDLGAYEYLGELTP